MLQSTRALLCACRFVTSDITKFYNLRVTCLSVQIHPRIKGTALAPVSIHRIVCVCVPVQHKYIIQALVLRGSWPLSESQWAFAQGLKQLEKEELKGESTSLALHPPLTLLYLASADRLFVCCFKRTPATNSYFAVKL